MLFDQTEFPGVLSPDDSTGWWRAYGSGGRVLYVSETGAALPTVGTGDQWNWVDSSGCQLSRADPFGMVMLSWQLDGSVDSAAATIDVVVLASACPDTTTADVAVALEESIETIAITALRRPFGPQALDCNLAPTPPLEFPMTVELDAPIGDRELLDGRPSPAEPID